MSEASGADAIAIVGLAGRFPGAASIEAFWRHLCAGTEAIRTYTDADLAAAGVPAAALAQSGFVKAGALLDGVDRFEPAFFGFTPREAELLDPQHRLFLECAWEALETAGYDPARYAGPIGLFGGASLNTYLLFNLAPNRSLIESVGFYQTCIANDKDSLTTQAAYKLNLRGPCVTVQTACSTSLVAVHLACQQLLTFQCDLALAGGVSVKVPHVPGYQYQEGGIASPDGHCRPFDAAAQGTVSGSGCGVVALKRLDDALADRDTIVAVIRGSAVNNDGSQKVGFTAPGVDGQAEVIALAQAVAGLPPETIGFVEAHGTGTPLGDPIEVAALTKVFRASTDRRGFCALGSVKSNIGHLDAAAGVAGLIKAALAVQRGCIPPTLHFREPNPRLQLADSPFFVNALAHDWTAHPRRAGVSSFGIGGTNAHVVIEQAPARPPAGGSRPVQLLTVAARTERALEASAVQLAAHLRETPTAPLADVAFTLQAGRKPWPRRLAVVAGDAAEAAERLTAPAGTPGAISGAARTPAPGVAFLFPGQGAQRPGMGAALYRAEPTFRADVDRACERLQPILGVDLRELLLADEAQAAAAVGRLTQTAVAQPAIFVVEHALAQLWMHWGVQPAAMIGHSLGEYVAACLAGVFTLDDALALVAERGRLMQTAPAGAMLAVALPAREVAGWLDEELALAADNAPRASVVAGPAPAIARLEAAFGARGVACRRLQTSHAFHCALMDPILDAFGEAVARTARRAPAIPFVSNLTGTWIQAEEAVDPSYWVRHLRHTVRFTEGARTLLAGSGLLPLEVGPGRALAGFCRQVAGGSDDGLPAVASLPGDDEVRDLLAAAGSLWVNGVAIDWEGFHDGERPGRVPLPTYPFERTRCWVDPPAADVDAPAPAAAPEPTATAMSGTRGPDAAPVDGMFYVPRWQPQDVAAAGGEAGPALVVLGTGGEGRELARGLARAGRTVRTARPGGPFGPDGADGAYIVPPNREGFTALLDALAAGDARPRIIYYAAGAADAERTDEALTPAFFGLLGLAQAIGASGRQDPVSIVAVASGLFAVTGQEMLRAPAQALLLGPCHVIPQEYPHVACRLVDVGPLTGEAWTAVLEAETPAPGSDVVVAYRDGTRYVRTFEPIAVSAPVPDRARIRRGGVYWITGGLGGVGLAIAHHLARTGGARLLLTGRAEVPPRASWEARVREAAPDDRLAARLRELLEIEREGGEVIACRADVTDAAAMEAAATEARRRFGRIDGVVHAAGVPGGGVIALKTVEAARRVLDPKVEGTVVLASLLDPRETGFLVLCSSIAGLQGGFGQVDYAAANAFLDAFAAHHARARGLFTTAIDWDAWREVGMAVDAAEAMRRRAAGGPVRSLATTGSPFDAAERQADGTVRCRLALETARDWRLDEHRLNGEPLLPGTAYLEMIAAALALAHPGHVLMLEQIVLGAPLLAGVPAATPIDVEVLLVPRAGTGGETVYDVKVRARRDPHGDWTTHAAGTARVATEVERGAGLEEACARFAGAAAQPVAVESAAGSPLAFGPRWTSRRTVRHHGGEMFSEIELPAAFEADLPRSMLHPALLDVALGVPARDGDAGLFLPFMYERVVVRRPLPGRVSSWVRPADAGSLRQTRSFDVSVFDEAGEEVAAIQGYTVKRWQAPPGGGEPAPAGAPPANDRLRIGEAGNFETLQLQPAVRRAPAAGEVEIEVRATGLNFRDVLKALGVMPLPAEGDAGGLGDECAGIVSAVGPGVTHVQAGDPVIAVADSCFGHFVTVPAAFVARKPGGLGFDEAAAVPIAFMTAYHALFDLGRLAAGERVLVQAAAGGVGLAAVQLALRAGARVFATAGSREKRAFLEALGVEAVMDSRSLAFVDEVRRRTGGEGVDVVLNSLAGEHIPAGLSVLRRYGRFLELGKRDIAANATLALAPFERSLSFIAANLERDHPAFPQLLRMTAQRIGDGDWQPLPAHVFPMARVSEAFTHLARARHIGKVVASRTAAAARPPADGFGLGGRSGPAVGLRTADAVDAFARVVGADLPQVAVSTIDLAARIARQRDAASVIREAVEGAAPVATRGGARAAAATSEGLEGRIAAIWERVLGLAEIGVHDSFFDLGGDSLAGVQVMSQMNAQLQTRIPVARFFEAPTIAGLAALVRAEQTGGDAEPALASSRDRGSLRRASRERRRPGGDRG
ncbi:MAG: SDR family NAD(P)-dependent oxidoreductase [Acidobacteriota bacterium]|nr:SDR family NAD(P)-dependent oxidoreductase [Acidobacteriota bacterium]